MATCHGPDSPYGCGHHKEHVRAARKGWITRRRSQSFLSTRDADDLRRVVGPSLAGHHVHRSKSGKRVHMMKVEGQWFSMDQREYAQLVRAGRSGRLAEERAKRNAPKNEARYRAAQEKQQAAIERAELREVRHIIKRAGGIRPSVTHSGVKHDMGEYRNLPSDLRRKNGGLTMDQAREAVAQHMPWLNLDTPDDLVQYFERAEDRRNNRAYAAKFNRAS